MNSLKIIMVFAVGFITIVQCDLCITNALDSARKMTILNGEYIESSDTYNGKSYYTLNLDSNCGYNSAVIYYNDYDRWQMSPDAAGQNTYFAICSSTSSTPQTCSSWTGTIISMDISSSGCTKFCSSTLEITGSSNSNCNGDFTKLEDKDDIFFNSINNYYWYFNYRMNQWICSSNQPETNLGCSISYSQSVVGYDSISSIGSCISSDDGVIIIDAQTTAANSDTGSTFPVDIEPGCNYWIDIEGKTGLNTFVNGEWELVTDGSLINGKYYYIKDGYYLYFVSGCYKFNMWIIDNSLDNGDDDNICSVCSQTSYSCSLSSYYAQCLQDTDNLNDCNGKWQFPVNNQWQIDEGVVISGVGSVC